MRGPKHYGLNRRDFTVGLVSNFLIDHFGKHGLKAAIWVGRHHTWNVG
jgi:hypothetical protein